MILTYLVCLVTTTTEGVHNLLFPLYLDHYGFALTVIGTLSSLLGVMRLASRLPIGARYRGSRAKGQQLFWLAGLPVSANGQSVLHGHHAPRVPGTPGHRVAIRP